MSLARVDLSRVITLNHYRRLFLPPGLACLIALLSSLVVVRSYPAEGGDWPYFLGCLLGNAMLVTAYLLTLRRLYGFSAPARMPWFIFRGTMVDPIASIFVMALLLALFGADSDSNSGAAGYLFVLFALLWFLDLVLIGRHFTDLRPFVRGESTGVPWPHHDGKKNCPEAHFFRPPPAWLGEIISAGSSLRAGEALPPLRITLGLVTWTTLLGSLLCVTILIAAGVENFAPLPVMLAIYALLGALAAPFLLARKRICSYVGSLGAVEYRMIGDGQVVEWSVLFSDFQRLKEGATNYYSNGIYNGTSESRCFESADGSRKQAYSYNWNNPAITRAAPDLLPDVRQAFWQKIETVWANREDSQTKELQQLSQERISD